MAVMPPGHAKDLRPVPSKAESPIEVTASRPVIDVREEASEKA
jgi:hypothetical protein